MRPDRCNFFTIEFYNIVLDLTSFCMLLTGIPGPPYQKEEFVKVDNENRVKEAKVIEAGFLLFGFQSYLMRFEIVKKDNDSSVIRSTVEYEIDDKHASNASLVTTDLVATIAQVIAKYLKDQKSSPPSS